MHLHEAAVSRALELRPPRPLKACEVEGMVSQLLLGLAERLSVKGVVPGHIKAFVTEGERYAAFSCTKPGKVVTRASKEWSGSVFLKPSLRLNVVVFGPGKGEVEELVERCLSELPHLRGERGL
ncbi:hypothetical protein Tph_c27950 [Thermacetogenium phaeum DSM 12270]|uniref:Uncharacterized protein n=1 Tax=Thermacetogenium phaeum (strain ATCC BAA-254 / DSM 26808 / PB) TaxID=1089553 RepID=K4LLX0_THEPS|nr:hypothetical protein [Thermacetogenium phaeum]AFV12960.1 hypothetical protein Tph_c27950 [Thermacetogenium phaeum DSM 12270]